MKDFIQKTITVLILVSSFYINTNAQNEITAVVLTQEATKYFQAAEYQLIKVGYDGTTVPINGYKMFYNKNDKSVLIAKHHTNPPGTVQIFLRGGVDFFCTKGCEEEGCVIEKVKKGVGHIKNSVRYQCTGCFKEGGGVELCEGMLLIRKVLYSDIIK